MPNCSVMASMFHRSLVAICQWLVSRLYCAAYLPRRAGVSHSGSKERERSIQFVGPPGVILSAFCTFTKCCDMRGQKVGNGQRVKMKVKPSACPLNWASEMGWPNWLVNL